MHFIVRSSFSGGAGRETRLKGKKSMPDLLVGSLAGEGSFTFSPTANYLYGFQETARRRAISATTNLPPAFPSTVQPLSASSLRVR